MPLYKGSAPRGLFQTSASKSKEASSKVTMRSLRSPLPLVPFILLWAVCSVWEAQAEVRGVKLCGREFIRAVVYTCGGSRWRRQNMEEMSTGELSSAEDVWKNAGLELFTRDINYGMTAKCCAEGCRKSELALLC